jgi:hypothetical protein
MAFFSSANRSQYTPDPRILRDRLQETTEWYNPELEGGQAHTEDWHKVRALQIASGEPMNPGQLNATGKLLSGVLTTLAAKATIVKRDREKMYRIMDPKGLYHKHYTSRVYPAADINDPHYEWRTPDNNTAFIGRGGAYSKKYGNSKRKTRKYKKRKTRRM